MNAIEEQIESAAPVCLAPWLENPYRLVSLLDMLPFLAYNFCRASSLLGQVYSQIKSGAIPTSGSWSMVAGELGMLERACEPLGLTNTLAQIRRVKPTFMDGAERLNYGDFAREVLEVQIRLNDELEGRMLFLAEPYQVDYLRAFTPESDPNKPNGPERDWSPVFVAFPSTKYDAIESFRSYGFGRNTASVFHLMRVLELGLTSLGAVFAVSLANTNWAPALDQIESKIRDMHKDPVWKAQPDCKEQQEFYAQAASHFGVFKDAWRNYTAHARGKYDRHEASDILISVRAFMQKLATRLHE